MSHPTQPRAAQQHFSVNIWAGLLGDHTICPVPWITVEDRRPSSLAAVCMEFFFCCHRKSTVYETSFASVEDFIDQKFVAAGRIRCMPGIFQNVRNSMQNHCHIRQTTSGGNFQLLLYNKQPFNEMFSIP
ncbi:hypothetical protein TNCV_3358071 [Trichonephila clavipes]|nr:hypothetical protein TNCV_3358071 [Trichonephila clavipes]